MDPPLPLPGWMHSSFPRQGRNHGFMKRPLIFFEIQAISGDLVFIYSYVFGCHVGRFL